MVDPSDLLVFLAVARARTYVGAAASLGLNHTTVGRRLAALEREMGEKLLVPGPGGWDLTASGRRALVAAESVEQALKALPGKPGVEDRLLQGVVRVSATEVFGLSVVVPAFAAVREQHPQIELELLPVKRPGPPYGRAVDIEIGVTKPPLARIERRKLTEYRMGLFASAAYLESHGRPSDLADLADHLPIYYIESMLEVADLDLVSRFFPHNMQELGATSVLAQLEMTRLGMGIGILPDFLAAQTPELERLLAADADVAITYWMSGSTHNLRRPEVRIVTAEIERQTGIFFGDLAIFS